MAIRLTSRVLSLSSCCRAQRETVGPGLALFLVIRLSSTIPIGYYPSFLVQYPERDCGIHSVDLYAVFCMVIRFPCALPKQLCGAVPCMVIRLASTLSTVPRLPGAVPGERLWVVTLAGRESSPHNSLLCNQQTLYQTHKNIYKYIHTRSLGAPPGPDF